MTHMPVEMSLILIVAIIAIGILATWLVWQSTRKAPEQDDTDRGGFQS